MGGGGDISSSSSAGTSPASAIASPVLGIVLIRLSWKFVGIESSPTVDANDGMSVDIHRWVIGVLSTCRYSRVLVFNRVLSGMLLSLLPNDGYYVSRLNDI